MNSTLWQHFGLYCPTTNGSHAGQHSALTSQSSKREVRSLPTSCYTPPFDDRLPHARSKTRLLKVQMSNFQNIWLHEVICVSREAQRVCVYACAWKRVLISEGVLAALAWGESVEGESKTPVQATQVLLPSLPCLKWNSQPTQCVCECVCSKVSQQWVRLQASPPERKGRDGEGAEASTTTWRLSYPCLRQWVGLCHSYNWRGTAQDSASQKPITLICVISLNISKYVQIHKSSCKNKSWVFLPSVFSAPLPPSGNSFWMNLTCLGAGLHSWLWKMSPVYLYHSNTSGLSNPPLPCMPCTQ